MIRGTKQITPKKLNYDINFSIHNRFDVEVIDSRTGEIRQKAQAHNVICNGLWECLCSTTAGRYYDKIGYGSGSGTPSVNDTKLFHQEGYKNLDYTYDASGNDNDKISYQWDWDTGVVSQTQMITLSETELVGVTLTEVGIISAQNNNLSTHAMLKDMNGNEISIEKTATDIINIYSTIFIHFNPKGYSNGGILMYFWNYGLVYELEKKISVYMKTVLSWLFGFFPWSKFSSLATIAFKFRNNSPIQSRSSGTWGSDTEKLYTLNSVSVQTSLENKEITLSAARIPANSGNWTGISTISIVLKEGASSYSDNFYIQVKDSLWYPYTQITSESVGTGDGETKDFSLKFSRAHDAKIYIDGVESEATVKYIPPLIGIRYLIPVMRAFSDGTFLPGFYESDIAVTYQTKIYYNPWYESYGISSINKVTSGGYSGVNSVKVSNDLSNWITVENLTLSSGKYLIPEEYQNYKYWDFSGHAINSDSLLNFSGGFTGKAVHFATPPAAGSVITADYKTDTIAKDENHVFDFSLTIHLGEYSGV